MKNIRTLTPERKVVSQYTAHYSDDESSVANINKNVQGHSAKHILHSDDDYMFSDYTGNDYTGIRNMHTNIGNIHTNIGNIHTNIGNMHTSIENMFDNLDNYGENLDSHNNINISEDYNDDIEYPQIQQTYNKTSTPIQNSKEREAGLDFNKVSNLYRTSRQYGVSCQVQKHSTKDNSYLLYIILYIAIHVGMFVNYGLIGTCIAFFSILLIDTETSRQLLRHVAQMVY